MRHYDHKQSVDTFRSTGGNQGNHIEKTHGCQRHDVYSNSPFSSDVPDFVLNGAAWFSVNKKRAVLAKASLRCGDNAESLCARTDSDHSLLHKHSTESNL